MGTVHLFISLAWSLTFLALTLVLTSCDVNVPVTNHWNGGFQGNACVPITKELTHWTMHLRFDHPVNSLEVWNADVKDTSADMMDYTLVNKHWNALEHVGDKLCIDFLGHGNGHFNPKVTASIEELPGGGGSMTTLRHTSRATTASPTSRQTAGTQPSVTQTGMIQTGMTQPAVTQTGITQPAVTQPGITQTGMTQPAVTQPGMTQPAVTQPGMTQPGMTQTGMTQPAVTQPGMTQTGMTQSAVTHPGMTQTGMTQTGVTQTSLTQAGMTQPTTKQPITTRPNTPKPVELPTGEGVAGTLSVIHDWGQRFEGQIDFPVKEDVEGWMANITFSAPVTKMDVIIGDPYWHSADGRTWVVVNKQDRPFYHAGDTINLRFFANFNGGGPAPSATAVLVNMGVDSNWTVTPPPDTVGSKYNYDDVLMKSILFYEAQRSGKLPDNNRIPWRGDSALQDQGLNGEDLTGGWYDAGDHVKFNFPMAYTSVVLSWGLLEFKDAYQASGQLQWIYDCIRWPLEYLLKCHVADDVLYVQVGDGNRDHSYWGRPEEMTMDRPAFKVDPSHPGSDVAMETAAAFASGAMVFNETDPTYSALLLTHAKVLWQFAVDHPGKYSDSVPAANGFYPSFNYTDEMCWGSMWLYKATGEDKYLAEARKWFDGSADWGMSWDDKIVGCQLLLFEATGEDAYRQAVAGTLRDWLPGGSIQYTPHGLAWRLQWAPLRYASNMAMAALMAAKDGINAEQYRHWAMCQIHYVLGDTGFSYVVGFGDQGYPLRAHHRGASCPNPPAPCGPQIMSSNEPNVHTLYGAVVGGPGQRDDYQDLRSNYVSNEVACDYNAGFQTAVAGLRSLLIAGEHPEQTGNANCPYTSS